MGAHGGTLEGRGHTGAVASRYAFGGIQYCKWSATSTAAATQRQDEGAPSLAVVNARFSPGRCFAACKPGKRDQRAKNETGSTRAGCQCPRRRNCALERAIVWDGTRVREKNARVRRISNSA